MCLRKHAPAVTVAAAVGALVLAATATAVPTERKLVRVERMAFVSRATIAKETGAVWKDVRPKYAVAAYRITYRTVTPAGRPTTATGLLVVPLDSRGPRPLVVYGHGTTTDRRAAPSAFRPGEEGRLIGTYFATSGFAFAAPDYLGLGRGPGFHPYAHAPSEASASRDLIVAIHELDNRVAFALQPGEFLTGFSQGGQAAMATADALAQGRVSALRIRGAAPIAGPYDLSATEYRALFDSRQVDARTAAFYLSYVLVSWNPIYHLYSHISEVFTPPYARIVTGLFDGRHAKQEIAAALPATLERLFTRRGLAWLRRPTGRLRAALRENDLCERSLGAPVRLYAGRRDRDVVFANALRCAERLRRLRTDARVVAFGDADHDTSALLAIPRIRAWFNELRVDDVRRMRAQIQVNRASRPRTCRRTGSAVLRRP